MMHLKRLLAKFNVYKLKIKKLERKIETLWGVIDELGRILRMAAELRQIEEQQRLSMKPTYTERRFKKIFGVK
jgi:hypothetical protein